MNNIIIFQIDVTRQSSIQKIFIEIDNRHQSSTSIHLDVTQRTQRLNASSHRNGMENCGERRHIVSARIIYLTHDIHHDGASLSQSQANT